VGTVVGRRAIRPERFRPLKRTLRLIVFLADLPMERISTMSWSIAIGGLITLCGCSNCNSHCTFQRFQEALRGDDPRNVTRMFSTSTVEALGVHQRKSGGDVGAQFATWLTRQTRSELPFRQLSEAGNRDTVNISFAGRSVRGNIRLIREHGDLKIDLERTVEAWAEWEQWRHTVASQIRKEIDAGAPQLQGRQFFPGTDIPFITNPDPKQLPELPTVPYLFDPKD
jgi:hypothetical protein